MPLWNKVEKVEETEYFLVKTQFTKFNPGSEISKFPLQSVTLTADDADDNGERTFRRFCTRCY